MAQASRPIVILVPGMLNTAAAWSRVSPRLQDVADVRIADVSTQSDIPAMARDALALIAPGERAYAVGFSMGGFVVCEMLAQAAERIAGIALVDTSLRTESPRQAQGREKAIAAAQADFEGNVLAAAGDSMRPARRQSDAELVALIRDMQAEVGLDGFVRQSRALMTRKDYREVLSAVTVPALVLCGTEDALTPPVLSEELAEAIPGAELVWIHEAAHMVPLEQPEQLATALRRWLRASAASVATASPEDDAPRAPWQDVLDFWFHAPDHPDYLTVREAWFRKDASFDAEVRTRFGPLIDGALAGGLRDWEAVPDGALARVLILDQFTRNTLRDTADAFAGDVQALALALQVIDAGWDVAMPPVQRQFVYLPLMHAEDLEIQQRCVELYRALAAQAPSLASALDFARRHRDIVARFGRFPHRNAALGRDTTAEEAEFLTQPGSSF